ncbi:hypothetical protein BD779DRAFT_1571470, partial [Infundibulicybe gibba]
RRFLFLWFLTISFSSSPIAFGVASIPCARARFLTLFLQLPLGFFPSFLSYYHRVFDAFFGMHSDGSQGGRKGFFILKKA